MPSITIQASPLASSGAPVPLSTGTAFVAGLTDAGPPPTGPKYVSCQSLTDYVTAFGPWSATSSTMYNWLDEFFADSPVGTVAYVTRVLNGTEATAGLDLLDNGSHGTVRVNALTPGLYGNTLKIVVTTGSGNFTITVNDSNGNLLETWGPYGTTAALYAALAATPSRYVTMSQSQLGGNTTANPVALSSTALSGGLNPTAVDADHVAALANFPSSLGPGTVSLPGKTTATCWSGIDIHCAANNRFGLRDMVDRTSAASAVSDVSAYTVTSNSSYGIFVQGSAYIAGLTASTTRTVPGSAAVASLLAEVARTNNQNTAPCGNKWPIANVMGFTTFFGPVPGLNMPVGCYSWADVATLQNAGINCFANWQNTLCLFGFVTPISRSVDAVFNQASASRERMSICNDAYNVMARYLFDTIDGPTGNTITNMQGDLNTIGSSHFSAGALFSDTGTGEDSFKVITGPPVNTDTTIQAHQLNAQFKARISPYADAVTFALIVVPVTQSVV